MNRPQGDKPHVVFLFSDTGGGHRSASEAIIEALNLEFPEMISAEMVDFLKDYAPPPFDSAPRFYPPLARMPDVWGLGYSLSNGTRRSRAMYQVLWPYIRSAANRIIYEHPCDLYVSVHPVANAPMARALGDSDPELITVVTDMVTTHAMWYNRRAAQVLVPTETARVRGIEYGLDPGQIEVVGLPVADRFCQPPGERKELRARLGWPQNLPVVLLVGGGEGMGPIEETAHAIAAAGLKAALVVIAGRNLALKTRLQTHPWAIPTFIYGFVREMPDFMRAADVLLTKAGPGTISESFIAGLPIILYRRLPGQEDGNVTYVVTEGAGVWAPNPDQVVEALRVWLEKPAIRELAVAACRRLARPDAARRIARIIAARLGVSAPVQPPGE